MQQLEFFDIPSPCIGVCQAGPKGYCLGCYRTREERLYWVQLEPDIKRKIVKACHRRKANALRRGKGDEQPMTPSQGDLWDQGED